MIEITATEFLNNPAYVQMLAKKEPVIVDNGDYKQVLVDYDEFINKTPNAEKSFVSLYDVFTNIPEDLQKALAEIEDIDDDELFVRQKPKGV